MLHRVIGQTTTGQTGLVSTAVCDRGDFDWLTVSKGMSWGVPSEGQGLPTHCSGIHRGTDGMRGFCQGRRVLGVLGIWVTG